MIYQVDTITPNQSYQAHTGESWILTGVRKINPNGVNVIYTY